MKKSIASKIEKLLSSMTGTDNTDNSPQEKETNNKAGHPLSAKNIGKFCRAIPISLFNLIRPAKTYDLK